MSTLLMAPRRRRKQSPQWQPGESVTVDYVKDDNRDSRCCPKFEPVTATLTRVRDLLTDPINANDWLLNPFQVIGRYGFDVVLEYGTRTIYQNGTKKAFRIVPVCVGLFDPSGAMSERMPNSFGWSIDSRDRLRRLLLRWIDTDFGDLRLCVFADDLQLVGGIGGVL